MSLDCMDLVTVSLSLFLQDWELAKVAFSCHMALHILCQEMYEVERRRGLVWVLSGPADILPFSFVVVCTPCAFLE